KFKEISEAYAVLSDSQKKQLYDQYGHAGIDSRYTTEDIFRGTDFSSFFGGGGVSDIIDQLFGGSGFSTSGGGSQRRAGEDMQLQVSISLEDVSNGVEKNITFNRYDECKSCNGSGAEPGTSKDTCPTCRGSGQVRAGLGGFINFAQACPTCGGEGKVIKNPCRSCSGQGRKAGIKKLQVSMPKGVDTGSILRLKSEGNFGDGGRGDVYVYINVRPHTIFARDRDNIHCKIDIGVLQAVLGAEIDVPTLYGKVKMKIPAGTQPNTVFRLKNKGVANLRSKRLGDELVVVEVNIPTKLSSREKKLFKELVKLRNQ
ncbi:MAG: molecular chaperone DnaJ, partial [Candidatus Omnitrophica bacterium]|nr:molecular chaperone DnaJ [Candidatus Omnitrophota bacterium]